VGADWLPKPGDTLDERFELAEQIGLGPTGAVFVATRIEDAASVVVKIFHPDLFSGHVRGPNTIRLQRARMMKGDGLVTLEEIEVREGFAFVVMPPVGGTPLASWLQTAGELDEARIRRIVDAVGGALETIHQLGVHGDIKPSNIFVDAQGDVKVSDPWFLEGLAGIRTAEGLAPRAQAWLAPEQKEGTWQERPETDVYRLALLLAWLLAGRTVEGGRSLREQGVSCSDAIDQAFQRATIRDPGERFGQIRAFLEALGETPDDAAGAEIRSIDPLGLTVDSGSDVPIVGDDPTSEEAVLVEDAPESDAATRMLRTDSVDKAPESEDKAPESEDEAPESEDEAPESEVEASMGGASIVVSTGEVIEVTPADMPAISEDLAGQSVIDAVIELPSEAPLEVESETVPGDRPKPSENRTMREVPGPGSARALDAARAAAASDDPSPAREGDELGQDMSLTRKQSGLDPQASWRTNPIIVIGPLLLLLSLVFAVTVLNRVLDRRMSASAMGTGAAGSPTAAEGTKETLADSTPANPSNSRPAAADATTAADSANPDAGTAAAAVPAPDALASGDGVGNDTANPSDAAAPKGDAPPTAVAGIKETTDPKSVQCPGTMIRIRRPQKPVVVGADKIYDVWCIDRYEFPGKNRTPRTGVGLARAQGLCEVRGGRLCTRTEWRVACGGKYPYKGEFDPEACNSAAPGPTARAVKPSGSKLRCRSGWGAYDMVGNVAEWTADGRANGGSARNDAEGGTCYRSLPRRSGGADVGFRCCADPTATETKK
jgi:serine/threonine protein kinase